MATDPFGKNIFGGQTSIPGGTTSATGSTTTAAKANPYQYAGKGWSDPLAQEIAKKYLFDPNARTTRWNPTGGNTAYDQLSALSAGYHRGGASGGGYIDPLDPKNWTGGSGVYSADQADKMKQEYMSRGGLGTYEQQAQYPGATNWPMDASGNPLPRMNMATGKAESIVPGAPAITGGSGSSMSLSPDVLKKMWR